MYNLNKTYHKGKYRGGEWGKHIRPYLKRLGNKRFRKISDTLEATEQDRQHLYKKKTGKRHIKAKITLSSNGDRISSYYRTYRSNPNNGILKDKLKDMASVKLRMHHLF